MTLAISHSHSGERDKRWSGSVPLALGMTWLATLFFLWPGEHPLPAGALSSASFAFAPIVFPRARLVNAKVTPLNWMLFAFGLQLMLVPACVRIAGPSLFLLNSLPSDTSMNLVLLLSTAAFWAFCGAYHRSRAQQGLKATQRPPARGWLPKRITCLFFIGIGAGGLLLKFGSLAHFLTYLTDPIEFLSSTLDSSAEPATLGEAAGTFLSAFLGFGCVLLWCRSVDKPITSKSHFRWVQRSVLIGAIAFAYALMSYNRGSVAVPMVAIAAVVGKRLPGAALRYLIVTTATLAVLFTGLTLYRSLNSEANSGSSASLSLSEAGSYLDLMGNFQVYGQAPQFLAASLAPRGLLPVPLLGKTLFSSVLSPLPAVGKPFRDGSGTMLYNTALGRGDYPDQIPQFIYELHLDFNIFGVLGGFAVVGYAVASLQSRFDRADSALQVYLLQYASVWLGFLTVGGIDVLSQIAIYSAPPVYVYLWLRRRLLRRASPSNTPMQLSKLASPPSCMEPLS